jgi:hypothetical protein
MCAIIDLSAWANKPNIKIAFETYNRFGNNMFIDNISIAATPEVGIKSMENQKIMIYPNPTSGTITVYSGQKVEDLTFTLFNAQGSLVYSHNIQSTSHLSETLNLGNMPKGVYLVKIAGNNTAEQQKLIIR